MSALCRMPQKSVGSSSPAQHIPAVADGLDIGWVITRQLGISWLNLLLVCRRKKVSNQYILCSNSFSLTYLLLEFIGFNWNTLFVQQPESMVNSFVTSSLLLPWLLGAPLFPWDQPPSHPVFCHLSSHHLLVLLSDISLFLTNHLPTLSVEEKHEKLEKLWNFFFFLIQHYNIYYLAQPLAYERGKKNSW